MRASIFRLSRGKTQKLFINTCIDSLGKESIFSTCSGKEHVWDNHLKQKSVSLKPLLTTHMETSHIFELVLFPGLSYRLQSRGMRCTLARIPGIQQLLIYAMLNCSWSTAPTWAGIFSVRQAQTSNWQQKASFPFMAHEKGVLLTLQNLSLLRSVQLGQPAHVGPCSATTAARCEPGGAIG